MIHDLKAKPFVFAEIGITMKVFYDKVITDLSMSTKFISAINIRLQGKSTGIIDSGLSALIHSQN